MAVTGTNQGVGDLVQDGIEDLVGAIAIHQVDRQFDAFLGIATQAHGPFAAVEGKAPIVQAVLSHSLQGQLTGRGAAGVTGGDQGHPRLLPKGSKQTSPWDFREAGERIVLSSHFSSVRGNDTEGSS